MKLYSCFRKETNFRDLGGYPTKDGRKIKEGCFYRSALPALMNETEQHALQQLGIKTILDLRTDYEAYQMPDPQLSSMQYFRISGMRDKEIGVDFSQEGMKRMKVQNKEEFEKLFHEVYTSMVFNNQAFRFLMKEGKDFELYPLLFHCHTGKDRTGALAMLIEMALGVPDEILTEDYLYSNVSFEDKIHRQLLTCHSEQERNEAQAMAGVLKERGMEMIQNIYHKYKTIETFFWEEYGLNENDLALFRNTFLE